MRALVLAIGLAFLALPSVCFGQAERIDVPPELRSSVQRLVGENGATVCDVGFLQTTRPPTLIATIDYSGRHFCNEVIRIRLEPQLTIVQRFEAWEVDNVADLIQDINGDGIPDLAISKSWSLYEGAQACVATFPSVYSCSADTCVQATTLAIQTGFYDRALDRLTREIAQFEHGSPNQDLRRLECAVMERDKTERVLGINPHAGFPLAETWMVSPDPMVRRKAVAVFHDIADRDSLERLQILERDKDPTVAMAARMR